MKCFAICYSLDLAWLKKWSNQFSKLKDLSQPTDKLGYYQRELDPGLDESIATVLWASPRISNDIQEFKLIGDIFAHKYGKKYADACKADTLNNVNEKVKKRLGLEAPLNSLSNNIWSKSLKTLAYPTSQTSLWCLWAYNNIKF